MRKLTPLMPFILVGLCLAAIPAAAVVRDLRSGVLDEAFGADVSITATAIDTSTPAPTETPAPTVDYRATQAEIDSIEATVTAREAERRAVITQQYGDSVATTQARIDGYAVDAAAQQAQVEAARVAADVAIEQARQTAIAPALTSTAVVLDALERAELSEIERRHAWRMFLLDAGRVSLLVLLSLSSVLVSWLGYQVYRLAQREVRQRNRQEPVSNQDVSSPYPVEVRPAMERLAELLRAAMTVEGSASSRITGWRGLDGWESAQWQDALEPMQARRLLMVVNSGSNDNRGTYLRYGTLQEWFDSVTQGRFFEREPLRNSPSPRQSSTGGGYTTQKHDPGTA